MRQSIFTQKIENFSCPAKILEKPRNLRKNLQPSIQRHGTDLTERLSVGELFGQFPQSLVEADLGVNAVQSPH